MGPMFVEWKVRFSALFTNLVGWHASIVSFPLSDVILVQLACPLSDVTFCLHSGITNLSFYKHWHGPFLIFLMKVKLVIYILAESAIDYGKECRCCLSQFFTWSKVILGLSKTTLSSSKWPSLEWKTWQDNFYILTRKPLRFQLECEMFSTQACSHLKIQFSMLAWLYSMLCWLFWKMKWMAKWKLAKRPNFRIYVYKMLNSTLHCKDLCWL